VVSIIKKQWYSIVSPKVFDNVIIGEAMTSEPKNLINRVVESSLADLTKNFSKFYIKINFKVNKVENEKAFSEFVGHECLREYISQIIRSGTTRIDSNVIVTTNDNRKIRVKGILIFSRRVKRSIKSKAISLIDKIIVDFAAKNNFDDFIKAMILDDLSKEIKNQCKKLYPVSKVEIRKSRVIG